MTDAIRETIQELGPLFAIVWIVTAGCMIFRPQRYFNSLLLMFALMMTMLFVSGFFPGDGRVYFLVACFVLIMFALFMVPILLIINGIVMIRREALSLAHVLSLGLGVFVGIGEIATVFYVLGLSDYVHLQDLNPWFMLISFTVFYFSFLVLSFVIYTTAIQFMPHRYNFNYLIIHGCGLYEGDKMTKLLSNRVDKAIQIYNRCRIKPVIIPSGGRGKDEKISEAEAMKNYLLEKGIPYNHIIMEDQSTTTEENIICSKKIIESREGPKKTALISSNYHVYRCLRLAREADLKCTGIGADVAFYYWPSALIREFIAIFVEKKFLIWALAGYFFFIIPVLIVFLKGY